MIQILTLVIALNNTYAANLEVAAGKIQSTQLENPFTKVPCPSWVEKWKKEDSGAYISDCYSEYRDFDFMTKSFFFNFYEDSVYLLDSEGDEIRHVDLKSSKMYQEIKEDLRSKNVFTAFNLAYLISDVGDYKDPSGGGDYLRSEITKTNESCSIKFSESGVVRYRNFLPNNGYQNINTIFRFDCPGDSKPEIKLVKTGAYSSLIVFSLADKNYLVGVNSNMVTFFDELIQKEMENQITFSFEENVKSYLLKSFSYTTLTDFGHENLHIKSINDVSTSNKEFMKYTDGIFKTLKKYYGLKIKKNEWLTKYLPQFIAVAQSEFKNKDLATKAEQVNVIINDDLKGFKFKLDIGFGSYPIFQPIDGTNNKSDWRFVYKYP